MRIGHWSARRILLIWTAVLIYMVGYVLIALTESSVAREQALSLSWLDSLPPDSALTPTQRAGKDSALEILRGYAQDSATQTSINRLTHGLVHAFDGAGRQLFLRLAAFLGPSLVALALTAGWQLSRRRIASEAGA